MKASPAGERTDVAHLEGFWDLVSRKGRKLLALDYDGTLAPFCAARMEALPLDGVVPLLEEISRRPDTTLAVVSGRPLEDLQRLLLPWRGLMVGNHGFEKRTPGGRVELRPPDPEEQAGLDEALDAAREAGLNGRLEVKLASVAVHTRGLPDGEERRLEEGLGGMWGGISRESGLLLTRFNRGLELRAREWDKGRALLELLSHEPPGTFCVYIGDDLTDEDAFRAVRGSGIGIRVGEPALPTEAQGILADIPAVRGFLEAWVRLGRPDPGEG
jgi:trehalose 6-phosphate phosphatase